MPKKSTSADATDTPVENPEFNPATAVLVEPAYRHEPTARTVGYEQPHGDNAKALFTVTRQFIGIEEGPITPPATSEPAVEQSDIPSAS